MNSTIYGGSFGDAFKASVVGDLAAVGANAVGQGTRSLSLGNVLGHAAVGCAAAAANGKDCASGAIGGAGAAIANPLLDQAIGGADGSGWGSNPETAQQWQTATLQLGSMGASAAAAAALGKDGMTAALAAQNETVNNFLTKENIEAKQKRLAAAKTLEERAAIVKEYIGISADNRNKALADTKSVMTIAELEAVKDNLTTLVSGPTACSASQTCRTDVLNSISEINGILVSARSGENMEPVVLAAEAVLTLVTAGEYLVARNALRLAGVANSELTIAANAANSAGQLATRERLLANIEATRAGNASSRFDVHLARTDQIRWGYAPDDWSMTTLNVGDRVFGGLPGQSSYFTSAATLEASGGSRATLFQSLQVKPHPEFGYRPKVGEYGVIRPSTVPTGVTGANPGFGAGNGEQFFIRNYQNSLKLIREVPLGQ